MSLAAEILLGWCALTASVFVWLDWQTTHAPIVEERPSSWAPDITGLVHVDDLLAGTLVSPRGVELQIADGWDFTDVMDTLADIDSLGERT